MTFSIRCVLSSHVGLFSVHFSFDSCEISVHLSQPDHVTMQSLSINLLALLGLTTLLYYTYKVTASIHLFLLHKSTLPAYQTPENSNYALVSGASDGIGRGIAEALLSRNFNVILHGRNATKLEAVKSDLSKQYPARQIRLAILDAAVSARDHAAVDALVSELKADNVKVSVLINNVGGASFLVKAWVPLHLREGKEIDALIDVNATFASQITRAMLPLLFEREKALIINIGSVTGELPSPYLTPYAGSKAYNAAWSRGLRAELRCEKKDVEVIHINVGEWFIP